MSAGPSNIDSSTATGNNPATRQTVFVTGASGYIGSAFVRAAIADGLSVRALARSEATAVQLRRAGAEPVIGDLFDQAGAWASQAHQADVVVHLAQPQTFGGRVTDRRARTYLDQRLAMDRALFEAVDPRRIRRIVYVAGTSYYGDTGTTLCNEDTPPNPRGWGPYLAPAIDALDGYVDSGLPIVTALPGWVYGPASWFAQYVLEPLRSGRPVTGLTGRSRLTSPVHIDDCARALVHLTAAGKTGVRYFVVDDEPLPSERIVQIAAEALGVKPRGRKVPKSVLRIVAGNVVAESLKYENRLSNARLRATGFTPVFPTCEQGVPDVVATWLRSVASTSQRGSR